MKALVTGGGGFVGGHIARLLHQRGHEVTALGRRRYADLDKAGIATVQADICDAAGIIKACTGVDTVFHVAAHVGVWGRRRDFWAVNVEGTGNVLKACKSSGVGQLVFTSSPSVVFGDEPLCGVDESQPYPQRYLAPYPETKARAEQMVLEANSPNLRTAALRPHLIWGPGDPHLIPRIIERARMGKLVQVGQGKNLVDIAYIDNVADAHVRAAEELGEGCRCAGKAYFISQGKPVNLWEWLNEVLERASAPTVQRSISHRTAYRVGAVLEGLWKVLGLRSEPRMTRFLASQLAKSHYFDISAAQRDFGYRVSVSTEEGLERLIASLGGSTSET